MKQIFTLFPKYFVGSKNSDWRYFYKISGLSPDKLQFSWLTQLVPSLWANFFYAFFTVLYRLKIPPKVLYNPFFILLKHSVPWVYLPNKHHALYTNFHIPLLVFNRKKRKVIMEWDFFIFGEPKYRALLEPRLKLTKYLVNKIDVLIVRHQLSYDAFKEYYPNWKGEIHIIPYYLDYLNPVDNNTLSKKWQKYDMPKLLFIGNLAIKKGLNEVLAATNLLKDQGVSFSLTIVTNFQDGHVEIPEYAELKSNINQAEALHLIESSHLLLLSTGFDSMGLVGFEAMAKGCPILTNTVLPQQYLFGKYGGSVDTTQPSLISDAIKKLLDSPHLLKDASYSGVQDFKEKYHHVVVKKMYEKVFS